MTRNRLLTLAVVPLATVFLAASACPAAEPQAAFAVKDGWVAFSVARDGVPVNEARIKVFDGRGQPFATGETGPEGRGEFPLPPGHSFTVEIKVGDRTANPIPLAHSSARLFPSKVLLTFGLSPCCRMPSRGWAAWSKRTPTSDALPDATTSWLLAAGGATIGLFVLMTTVLIRAPRREQNPSKQEGPS